MYKDVLALFPQARSPKGWQFDMTEESARLIILIALRSTRGGLTLVNLNLQTKFNFEKFLIENLNRILNFFGLAQNS